MPSMNGTVVGAWPRMTPSPLSDTSDDGDWYKVTGDGVGGKAGSLPITLPRAHSHRRCCSDVAGEQPHRSSELPAAGSPSRSARRLPSSPPRINVRSGPGTNYGVVSSANTRRVCRSWCQSQDGIWYQVTVAGLADPGWVSASIRAAAVRSTASHKSTPRLARGRLSPRASAAGRRARGRAQHRHGLWLRRHRQYVAGRQAGHCRPDQAARF